MKKAFTLSEALVTLAIVGVLAAILVPVIDNVRPDKDKIAYKKALYNLQGAVSNAMDSAYVLDGFGTVIQGDKDGDGITDGQGWGDECIGGCTPIANIANWWGNGGGGSSIGEGGDSGNSDGDSTGGGTSTGGNTSNNNSFCHAIAASLNIAGKVNCDISAGESDYYHPNFITTDGIRYWGLESDAAFKKKADGSGGYKDIYVDRKIGQSEMKGPLKTKRLKGDADSTTGMRIRVKWNGKVYTPEDEDGYAYENGLIDDSFNVTLSKKN